MGLSMVIGYMAREGIRDLYDGLRAFEAAMYAYHEHKSYDVGLSFDDYIAEKVSIKAREFCSLLNPQPEANQREELDRAADDYRKSSGG
jgi:hypothetical protein